MKLIEITELVGGTIAGNEALEISGASGLEFAGSQDITYVSEPKFLPKLTDSKAAAVFVSEKADVEKAQIIHSNPGLAFANILNHFYPTKKPSAGIHPSAVLGENTRHGEGAAVCANVTVGRDTEIGDRTVLHPGVVVGDRCRIGNDTIIYPNTVLYPDTVIGNKVTIHAGSIIGADGFSYTPDEKGQHIKFQQIGKVMIKDNVEIGANTCIDRAAFGETVISEGVKIDNLVQIAHNCSIGEHSVIVSQTGIAGSCRIGKHNVIAGQTGIADHITIGDQVTLMARTGVMRDIQESGTYGWNPAMKLWELMQLMPHMLHLPELASKVRDLKRRLDKIEKS